MQVRKRRRRDLEGDHGDVPQQRRHELRCVMGKTGSSGADRDRTGDPLLANLGVGGRNSGQMSESAGECRS
jgi:hypothetical protein